MTNPCPAQHPERDLQPIQRSAQHAGAAAAAAAAAAVAAAAAAADADARSIMRDYWAPIQHLMEVSTDTCGHMHPNNNTRSETHVMHMHEHSPHPSAYACPATPCAG